MTNAPHYSRFLRLMLFTVLVQPLTSVSAQQQCQSIFSAVGDTYSYTNQQGQPQSWGAELGSQVQAAGDVNADGVGDFMACASYFSRQPAYTVIISGLTKAEITRLDGCGPLLALGDINSDGKAEIVISEKHSGSPRVLVYSASPTILRFSLLPAAGQDPGDQFGQAIALMPDITGDGRSEILVSSPATRQINAYSGANGALLFVLDAPYPWPSNGYSFGDGLQGVPDLTGDGVADILVGDPGFSNITINSEEGAVIVYSGALALAGAQSYSYSLTSTAELGHLGAAVEYAGDIDLDNHADFFLAQPGSFDSTTSGKIYLISGRTGAVIRTDFGTNAADQYGIVIDSFSDIDGDGVRDYAIGAPGGIQSNASGFVDFRSGRTGNLINRLIGAISGERFGESLSLVGDSNLDGHIEILVGAPWSNQNGPQTGRVALYNVSADANLNGTMDACEANNSGGGNNNGNALPKPKAPKIKSPKKGKLVFSWTKVADATYDLRYTTTTINSKGKKLKNHAVVTTTNQFTLKKIKSGTIVTAKYRVLKPTISASSPYSATRKVTAK